MAPTARAGFWQAWALIALVATLVPGVRIIGAARRPPLQAERVLAPDSRPEPRRARERVAAAPAETNDSLARLAVAETADERCRLLGNLEKDDPSVTYAIADVLERSQLDAVRACATRALTAQTNPEAQSWLIELSDDPAPEVRDSALAALATRDAAARAVVIEATHADDAELRLSAVLALLKAGRSEGFSAARAVLPSIEDRAALSALIGALGESHDAQALAPLEALLDDTDQSNRWQVIAALGELGVAAATAHLQRLLASGATEDLSAVASALVTRSPEQALPQLQSVLEGDDRERAKRVLGVIAGMDLPDVVPILKQQLESGDPARSEPVLHRLALKPMPELEAELQALAASDGAPRLAALRALRKLDTPSARATVDRQGALQKGARERSLIALARDPSDAAQAQLLSDIADPTRTPLLSSVVGLAPASTVNRIVEQADALGAEGKRQLIQGLAQRGDPRFLETLRAASRDQDQTTRNGALQGLIQLGDQAALAEAQRMASASDARERSDALELLTSADGTARSESEVLTLASDSDVTLVSRALRALQGRAPAQLSDCALRAFRAASSDDRVSLLSNVSDLKSEVTRPLYELALREGDDQAVIASIHALTELEGPDNAQRLASVLNDSNRSAEVRGEAAAGLRSIGGPLARSNRALMDSLNPPSEEEFTCDNPR